MGDKKISSSMEDYLEAIAQIKSDEGEVRVSDISRRLDVKKPSVNAALIRLREDGLVAHQKYGKVSLTQKGAAAAEAVRSRHQVIFSFLRNVLKVDAETAQEDACGMEHAVSPETLERLLKFMEFAESCPKHQRNEWLKGLKRYFKSGKRVPCRYCDESIEADEGRINEDNRKGAENG